MRAPIVLAFSSTVTSVAWAQAPAIPDTQPSPPSAAEASPSGSATPEPSSESGAPSGQPFTPAPGREFTPGQPAPPVQPGNAGQYSGAPPPAWTPPAYGWNGPPAYPPAYPPPPGPTEKPPRDVRVASAHADRVIYLPTAETHPSGTWYTGAYFIAPFVGVAVSDRTQITLTGIGDPFARDPFGIFDFSVKSVLARGYRYRLAAIGATSGFIGSEQGFAFVGRAGFVAELCFDDECRSSFNVSSNLGLAGAIIALNGFGLVIKGSELVSVLVEGATLLGGGPGGVEEAHGVGGQGGVRFARERWGLDLALGGFARGRGEGGFPLGLIAFTYRFLP